MKHDFGGYATKYGVKCTDGRIIQSGAFKHDDGQKVPLIWQHQHNDTANILGHAILKHKNDGTYVECYLNNSTRAKEARELITHGDIDRMSIYANKLKEQGSNVIHGSIKEVSLVIAGANPDAIIDTINFKHGDLYDDGTSAMVHVFDLVMPEEDEDPLEHADDDKASEGGDEEKTVEDVFNTLNEEQKTVVYAMISEALEDSGEDDSEDEKLQQSDMDDNTPEGNSNMGNVFDTTEQAPKATLTHSQVNTILKDAEKIGSLKESVLQHADEYGITNIDMLFPDAKAVDNTPEWISRRMEWVSGILGGVKRSPFSRIKSRSADITHADARAKGYIKGNRKKDEYFGLSQRITTPTTVYKKQKLDRDDIIDVTDFDVVAWIKAEMRVMIDEEFARAILIGDGRPTEDPDNPGQPNPDKIRDPQALTDGAGIRSIAHDDEFYAHPVTIPAHLRGDSIVDAFVRSRPKYKGKGTPTMYCREDFLTDMLLIKNKMGDDKYPTLERLATKLRVDKITVVDVLEDEDDLLAIVVNINDYTVGADRGGSLEFFDDFDIDFNQYKYLYEFRASGALTKHKTALVYRRGEGTQVTPTVPGFDVETGVMTVPSITGVVYTVEGAPVSAGAQDPVDAGDSVTVIAIPDEGYYFPHNIDVDWTFTRNA